MDPETFKKSLRPAIIRASYGKGFGPSIIHGLIEKESNYRPMVSSPTGVKGLCQITRNTAKEVIQKNALVLADSRILDPNNQIILSSIYLQNLLQRSYKEHVHYNYQQHLIFALQSYNSGYGSMQMAVNRGGWKNYKMFLPRSSDRHYAERVLNNSKSWQKSQEATTTVVVKETTTSNTELITTALPFLGVVIGGIYLFLLTKKLFNIGG